MEIIIGGFQVGTFSILKHKSKSISGGENDKYLKEKYEIFFIPNGNKSYNVWLGNKMISLLVAAYKSH